MIEEMPSRMSGRSHQREVRRHVEGGVPEVRRGRTPRAMSLEVYRPRSRSPGSTRTPAPPGRGRSRAAAPVGGVDCEGGDHGTDARSDEGLRPAAPPRAAAIGTGAARRRSAGSRAHLVVVAGELQEGLLEVAFVGLEERRIEIPAASARATRSPSVGRDGRAEHVAVDAGGDARRRRARGGPPRGRRRGRRRLPSDRRTAPRGPSPAATRRPRATIATRSAICWTSERMWLETNTVRPSAPRLRSRSRTSTMPAGSSPLAGSSRISSAGSFSSAAAMPKRCFMPSE